MMNEIFFVVKLYSVTTFYMFMLTIPLMFNLYQEHPYSTGIWCAMIVVMNYMALDEMLGLSRE